MLRWVLGLGHCVWFVCCCCPIVVALATLHRFAQDREQTVPWQAVFLHKDISTCTRPTNLPKANNSCKNTVCTRVRFSCTVIHVALLFTGLKSVHYSTFLDFKCFSQMNLFKLNKVSFRNQCYCYNRLVL